MHSRLCSGSKSDSTESIKVQLKCPGLHASVFFIEPCHFVAAINCHLIEKHKIHMIDNYTLPYSHARVLFAFTELVGCLRPKFGALLHFSSARYIYKHSCKYNKFKRKIIKIGINTFFKIILAH